ncbi:MAG: GvpL/GvpF family gas vesicle protein, partial [Chloroflexi bacterium]|nr:GvpL/GvpF family gas vesicle protein [Chloroflexota bacterium]
NLEVITVGDLVAVVSETDATRIRPSRVNMSAHQRALEHIMMQRGAILPMRFGIIATNEAAIADQILIARADDLRAWLARMHGKQELGLKASWPRETLFAQARQHPDLAGLSPVTDVNSQIAVGQQVEAVLQQIHQETATQIWAMLEGTYVDARTNDQPLDETTSLNTALLIDAAAQDAFEAAVEACDAHFSGVLTFKLVGPLPVYTFVDLAIDLA